MPFLMLAYSLIYAILSYFNFYHILYNYLPDTVGYSLATNLFMYSVYMNNRYCTSIKIAVIGLIALNLLNLVYVYAGVNGAVYDVYLIVIIMAIIRFK